jgi:hypothetical protein
MKYRPRYCPIAWDKSTSRLINKTIKSRKGTGGDKGRIGTGGERR